MKRAHLLQRRREPVRARRGVTLLEVLIVVALIAVMTVGVVYGSGMFADTRKRAAATLIMSGVRMGLSRANATGKPVRMVFDLEANRVQLEEGTGAPMLRVKDPGESTGAGADPATEAEQKARQEAEHILEGPHAPRPHFTAVKAFGSDDSGSGRELGKGILYRQVQTEHDGEPRTSGQAYLYFWPGGATERASIQIKRDGEDKGLTVVVSGLTGRTRIERGEVPLPEPRADGEYSERDDE